MAVESPVPTPASRRPRPGISADRTRSPLVPGTQHFRNIHRHAVKTVPSLVTLRIDESLYFVNARFLEDLLQSRVTAGSGITEVFLMMSAVNEIDYSALESLEAANRRLKEMGIRLHLSEVKGPVMDRLGRSHFLADLGGEVFLSQYDAWRALAPGSGVTGRPACPAAPP